MSVVTTKKDINEIIRKLIENNVNTVMIIGCGMCAKSCKTGGLDEVRAMKNMLSKRGFKIFENKSIPEVLNDGACRYRTVRKLSEYTDGESFDSILVLACGAGLKTISDNFKDKTIIAGLNTIGIGMKEKLVCLACGDCSFNNGVCKKLSH
ncbi:hypothetical protein Mjas_01665 [Methanothermococcus sp. Ax23]|jgi:ferredoxin|uniref:hypothetical protein n=1 Tax=Methanothermococcus sp. Ax23 TaxID=3156486 RepID=UPI003B9F452E